MDNFKEDLSDLYQLSEKLEKAGYYKTIPYEIVTEEKTPDEDLEKKTEGLKWTPQLQDLSDKIKEFLNKRYSHNQ